MADPWDEYLSVWGGKPVLRAIYEDFYDRIAAQCTSGMTIEIGGGIGNLKRWLPGVVSTDIQFVPWLDCVADAQHLPFADGSAANIVMVDVLHHVEFPIRFFREAERLLQPGGRIVMVEPAITWGSTLFYRLLHQEPVRMSADPLVEGTPNPARDPYKSNQAIPTLIVIKHRERFLRLFPNFKISCVEWISLLAYPLSGGFKRWNLIPAGWSSPLLKVERALEPALGRWMAFRLILVITKQSCRT